MNFLRCGMISICLLALTSGCKRTHEPAAQAAPARSEQRIAEVRESLVRQNPSAIVGPVVEALPAKRLAAIADVPVEQFRRGDIITFVNTNVDVIDTGRVVNITKDQVHVRYDTPGPGQREPKVGDLGVLVVALKH